MELKSEFQFNNKGYNLEKLPPNEYILWTEELNKEFGEGNAIFAGYTDCYSFDEIPEVAKSVFAQRQYWYRLPDQEILNEGKFLPINLNFKRNPKEIKEANKPPLPKKFVLAFLDENWIFESIFKNFLNPLALNPSQLGSFLKKVEEYAINRSERLEEQKIRLLARQLKKDYNINEDELVSFLEKKKENTINELASVA